MNAVPSEQVLVVLTCAPSLENQLVDWLLVRDDNSGFSSVAIHGHSTRHEHLSIAEQVSGRQRRLQFQVQIAHKRLESFMEHLQNDFTGADVHYWVIPLLAGGSLN